MKKLTVLMIIITTFAFIVSACGTKTTETVAVLNTTDNNTLISEGHLQPISWQDQAFSVSGQISEILVSDGESVSTGQELARLADSPRGNLIQIQAEQEVLAAQQAKETLLSSAGLNQTQSDLALIQAEQQVDDAQKAVDEDGSDLNQAYLKVALATYNQAQTTQQTMKENEGIDPDLLDAVNARIDAANAALESAHADLEAQTLKASMDGTVVDLSLQAGQQISASEPVIVIADYSTWVIETDDLTELDVTKIEVGQKVDVVLDALPDIQLKGHVTHIDARYEEKRGDITYTATITLDQTLPELRWGMTAAVYFLP